MYTRKMATTVQKFTAINIKINNQQFIMDHYKHTNFILKFKNLN